MGVHIVIVLYYTARPKVEVEIRQVNIHQIHMKRLCNVSYIIIELVIEA